MTKLLEGSIENKLILAQNLIICDLSKKNLNIQIQKKIIKKKLIDRYLL